MTDVVVLVVAADDGVKPQTLESISHAREAGVPIVVALNKIDAPGADPDACRDELADAGVQVEERGGSIQSVEISALHGNNLDDLMEAISTEAEMSELWSDPSGFVEGVILEAKTVKGLGPVTTAVVKRGTLKRGSFAVAGNAIVKVRTMTGPDGKVTTNAGPSEPVEITGWRSLPTVGDPLIGIADEKRAKEVVEYRENKAHKNDLDVEKVKTEAAREAAAASRQKIVAEAAAADRARGHRYGRMYKQRRLQLREKLVQSATALVDTSGENRLRVILKSDVLGSEEAIMQCLADLSREDYEVEVIDAAIGAITDTDIEMATTFDARIICFNVPISEKRRDDLDRAGVTFKNFSVIYTLLDYVEAIVTEEAPKHYREVVIGQASVAKVFLLTGSKKAEVAGCQVESGAFDRMGQFRVVRNGSVLHTGDASSLKQHQEDVEKVVAGQECGLSLANFKGLKAGDIIESIEMVEE